MAQFHLDPTAGVEEFSALVDDIYDTALDQSKWPAALACIRDYVGGCSAGLFGKDAASRTGRLYYADARIDAEFAASYFATYVKLDPITTAHYFMGIGDVASTIDLLPYDEFRETRFYREWAEPQRLVDFVSSVVDKTATSITMFGVFRDEADGLADEGARARMRLVSPHVRRALLIGDALERKSAEADALIESIDAIRAGMMLLDARGRIVHANAAGHALLAGGGVIRALKGQLQATDAAVDALLRGMIEAAGRGEPTPGVSAVTLRDTDGSRYAVHLLPMTSGLRRSVGSPLAATALLLVHRAELATPAVPEVIAKAFGLTPSELRVLLAVVEVGGASEVAEMLGVAESTVRFHLKRLFEKTATHRQADLVKLVGGFASPLIA